jgi:hypothetical protein
MQLDNDILLPPDQAQAAQYLFVQVSLYIGKLLLAEPFVFLQKVPFIVQLHLIEGIK